MPGKVFISCGQATDEERGIAAQLKEWFQKEDFEAYVAIQAQTIQDVNSAIIGELKSSDYYVFIDFPRECLLSDSKNNYRGSLFTHQELAIAYLLGFEKVLFLQHNDVRLEGLLRYMASNAIKFSQSSEVVGRVKQAVSERRWVPSYTRHLMASNLHWSDGILTYISHSTGERFTGRFLYIDIQNHRHDIAAFNTVARLASISDPNGNELSLADRSHLKVTGQPGYSQTIWPQSHGAFDLLLSKAEKGGSIHLNSSLDLSPKPPIISQPGQYVLGYEVLAESFPVLSFRIKLNATGNVHTTEASLVAK